MMSMKVRKSLFDLSHDRKLSGKFGLLYPIVVEDVLPGDVWQMQSDVLLRFAPMLAPVMHRVNCKIDYFFVPNRLLWSNWESFITTGPTGEDTSVPPTWGTPPSPNTAGTLWDHMGLPTGIAGLGGVPSSLPARAYNKIWNEWYRDEDLQDKVPELLTDGADAYSNYQILPSAWEKDYFTSARPDTQKGPLTTLPLGSTAPVTIDADKIRVGHWTGFPDQTFDDIFVSGTLVAGDGNGNVNVSNTGSECNLRLKGDSTNSGDLFTSDLTGVADLANAESPSIDMVRSAFQINLFYQLNMRYGNRYAEFLRSHFGVAPQDYRLQRPEYLGGGVTSVKFSEVLQTSSTDETSPLATMAGHGYAALGVPYARYKAYEHGWILGLLRVVPKTAYSQGIPRKFLRGTWSDYAFPEFAHLGEQAIEQREIYAVGNSTTPFGYAPRYEEYRQRESSIHGDFRTTLDFWHLSREFDEMPLLNNNFVRSDTATDRIFAVQDGTDYLWIHVLNNIRCIRALPAKGVPGLIDHGIDVGGGY